MSTPLLLAIVVGLGILMIFIGLARTPSTNTAAMVQQRLSVYGGEKPLTLEEVELQRPFSGRFLRPAIERLGSLMSRSAPQKPPQSIMNLLGVPGRSVHPTSADIAAVRTAPDARAA